MRTLFGLAEVQTGQQSQITATIKGNDVRKTLSLGLMLLASLCSNLTIAAPDRDPSKLKLASVSALVAPLGSDEPDFAKRADWVMSIASVTKVMTALVVLESGAPLDEWLPVIKRDFTPAANAYSRIRLGSEAKRGDLLHIALMSSENRAAFLLARHHPGGYNAFIDAMNTKAKELGMTNTRFVDATGLSDDNVSTARDLLKLVNAAYKQPLIREVSTSPGRYVNFRNPKYGLQYGNTNILVHRDSWGVELSKTGYLDIAGRCLVMVTEMDGEPKAVVLLNSLGTRSPMGDAGRMRRWFETGAGGSVAVGARNYEAATAAARKAVIEQTAKLNTAPTKP